MIVSPFLAAGAEGLPAVKSGPGFAETRGLPTEVSVHPAHSFWTGAGNLDFPFNRLSDGVK